MPHATATFPFEPGDDDLGDFMLDIWLAFARDSCNWVDNRAPVVGTRPDVEVWTHRGSVGTPAPPYFFGRTHAQHMHVFTGQGVNTGEEIYDQPGNPANAPKTTSFTVPASGNIGHDMRCIFLNSLNGPYDAYWLFSDTTGEYIHCVIKVNSRQYRHFSVGLLRQADGGPDLDPNSFYIVGSFWDGIGTERLGWPTTVNTGDEHAPYQDHHLAFRNNAGSSPNGAFGIAMPGTVPSCWLYMPGLHPITLVSATVNAGGTGHAVDDIITLSLNDGIGTAPTLRVTGVTGGVIDTVSVETAGLLTNAIWPNTAVTQASTTGAGVDATFDLTQTGHSWYTTQSFDGLLVSGNPVRSDAPGGGGVGVGNVNSSINMGVAQSNAYDSGLGTVLWACDRNFTANANVLIPIYIAAAFDFQSDIRQGVVATIPDMFRVNMRDYNAEEVITVGGADYIVFPLINNNSVGNVAGDGYSGWEGVAYRRETGAVV